MQNNKTIYLILKIAIFIASIYFIYYKLSEFSELWEEFANFNFTIISFLFLLTTLILMFFNWLFESYKWKLLVSKIENVNILTSYKAILSGITAALLTPNRTGEFAGRILFLKPENRVKGSFATFVGSIAQIVITIINGLIGLFVIFRFHNIAQFEKFNPVIYYSLLSVILILTLFAYFNIGKIILTISKIRFLKKYSHFYLICNEYNFYELINVLILSTFRYAIFVIQFYLLFLFFNVNIHFAESYVVVASTYFIMFLIPSFTLAEIGIRGSIILFFGALFSSQLAGILSASTLLWIINLAIPSIIGSLTILNKKSLSI
ncbi:MAG: hypothetical protein A2033_14630 [Bacteroidetes bacterium GWA2_31_9]|nr:MAG: hypothetical protein A2033_14630 [Bacteroidetes bacterium GWA2_31_9]